MSIKEMALKVVVLCIDGETTLHHCSSFQHF